MKGKHWIYILGTSALLTQSGFADAGYEIAVDDVQPSESQVAVLAEEELFLEAISPVLGSEIVVEEKLIEEESVN